MKIAVIGDLHLPHIDNTPQWDFWAWAMEDLRAQKPDVTVVIGDISADGNVAAIRKFLAGLHTLPGESLVIRGNSDLRTNAEEVEALLPEYAEITLGKYRLIAADSGTGQAPRLRLGPEKTLLFTHHDFSSELAFSKNTQLYVFGHVHEDTYRKIGDTHVYSVCGCDPDKTIGAPPQVSYFEVGRETVRRTDHPWPQAGFDGWSAEEKAELLSLLGISIYDPISGVAFATENAIQNIELRPNAVDAPREALLAQLKAWRAQGGRYLSVHMPDIGWSEGALHGTQDWEKAVELVKAVAPEGLTVHVPKASVADMAQGAQEAIGDFLTRMLEALPRSIQIGIENMHMTDGEPADDRRRFGYIPQECQQWAAYLALRTGRKLKCHLDVGHARNNRPFSQPYTLGVWYAALGQNINAYHIHQTTKDGDVFHNHQPIDALYGCLISYGGFLASWKAGRIAHRPMLVEVKDPRQALASMHVFIRSAI